MDSSGTIGYIYRWKKAKGKKGSTLTSDSLLSVQDNNEMPVEYKIK